MATTRKKLDLNQLAKSIVYQATGEEEIVPPPKVKNQAAIERGKKGGAIGGTARALKLTPAQRSEIAKFAINTRWKKQIKPLS